MQSDYFRLCYILLEGGCYLDADDVHNGPAIEHLFDDGRLKIQPLCYDIETDRMVPPEVFTEPGAARPTWIFYFNNNPLLAAPGHPIVERALANATAALERATDGELPEIQSTTGPGNLTRSIFELAQQSGATWSALPVLRDWEDVASSRWPLSYRSDTRNWRLSNRRRVPAAGAESPMNPTRGMLAPTRFLYRLGLKGRRLLPRQRCHAFGPADGAERIERIYVINLDRQPDRWAEMRRELTQILDCSGDALTERTVRFPAVDARSFARSPEADDEVGPIYTLGDQLFVEPQPRVLPDRFELDRPIRMSWPEVAVARSHVGVWRRIATGEDAYALVLEDDAWFKLGVRSIRRTGPGASSRPTATGPRASTCSTSPTRR